MIKSPNFKKTESFTLIEVLVGTFLILVVFLGIFAAYQLGLKVVSQSKNRIVATALANEEIEKIRNLPYSSVGIKDGVLPVPDGILDATTTIIRSNIEYGIERQIKYIVDDADGIGEADLCDWDYKKVEIKVSWAGQFSGDVKLVTDVAPESKVEEINACTAQPGGILSVEVADENGVMVSFPLIEIINPATGELIASAQPDGGKHDFPLVASIYKVVVSNSKPGYNSSRTYGTDEVATPEKPHKAVWEGGLANISFAGNSGIEKVSSFSIDTLSPWGMDYFSDSFLNENKVSELSDVVISEGEAVLASADGEYVDSGFLISVPINPANLISWQEFSFNDSEPSNTDLKYHIYYYTGIDWDLVPEGALPGNQIGFDNDTQSVDLSQLDKETYSQLRIQANFQRDTADDLSSVLYDWQVSWRTSEAVPLPNITFHLQGEKTIGTDGEGEDVYKYSQEHISGGDGHIDIPDLEWDNYTFSVDPATDLYIESIDPSRLIGLAPDTSLAVILYLSAQNSLLVTVQDVETGEPIFAADVRLYNSDLSYDETQFTDIKGQTYFIPLKEGNYIVKASLDDDEKSEDISILGYKSIIILLLITE